MESRRVRGPAQGGARTGLAYETKRDRRSPPSARSRRKVRWKKGMVVEEGKARRETNVVLGGFICAGEEADEAVGLGG